MRNSIFEDLARGYLAIESLKRIIGFRRRDYAYWRENYPTTRDYLKVKVRAFKKNTRASLREKRDAAASVNMKKLGAGIGLVSLGGLLVKTSRKAMETKQSEGDGIIHPLYAK